MIMFMRVVFILIRHARKGLCSIVFDSGESGLLQQGFA